MGYPTDDEIQSMKLGPGGEFLAEHYFPSTPKGEIWINSRGSNVDRTCQHCGEKFRNRTDEDLLKHLLEQHNIKPGRPRKK